MATTVKVTNETSGDLDALAARLFLKTRKKVSKQELVTLLAKLGGENEDALVARILGRRRPIPDAAWRRLRSSGRLTTRGTRTTSGLWRCSKTYATGSTGTRSPPISSLTSR